MVGTARFHRDIDGGVTEIYSMIGAVVRSFDDVGAVVGQNTGETVQRSGIVGQVDAETHEASIFDKAALDDAREQRDVDIAAADQNCRALSFHRQLVI